MTVRVRTMLGVLAAAFALAAVARAELPAATEPVPTAAAVTRTTAVEPATATATGPPPAPAAPPAAAAATTEPTATVPSAAPAAPPAAAAATTEPTATVPPAAPAAAGVPAIAVRHAVLLPVSFTVYQSSVGAGLEAVPDWTETARANLKTAVGTQLAPATHIEIVPLPELDADESAQLNNYLGLARLITIQGHALGSSLKPQRATFDRHFGNGLAFLREKSGADVAIVVDGMQIKQSGGSIFMQLALAATGIIMVGGGGTSVSLCILDLKAGEVAWFNSTVGVEVFGMSGKDIRALPTAEDVIHRLVAPFPAIPALAVK